MGSKAKLNILNFNSANISSNLDGKLEADFYPQSLFDSKNITLTDEGTIVTRKGSYLTSQDLGSELSESLIDEYLPHSNLLELNDPSGTKYFLVRNQIYKIVGDSLVGNLELNMIFTTGGKTSIRLQDYDVFGSFGDPVEWMGYPGGAVSETAGKDIAFIYKYLQPYPTISDPIQARSELVRVEGALDSATVYEHESLAKQGFLNSCLFFQGRLAVSDDIYIRFSRGISPDYVVKDQQYPAGGASNKVHVGLSAFPPGFFTTGKELNGFQVRILSGYNVGEVKTVPADDAVNYNVSTQFLTVSTAFSNPFVLGSKYTVEVQIGEDPVKHYGDFEVYDGGSADTDAIEVSIFDLERRGNTILWLEPYKNSILIGTKAGLYIARSTEEGQAIAVVNLEVVRINDTPMSSVRPLVLNNIIYAFAADNKLYAFNFDWRADAIQGVPVDVLSREFDKLDFKEKPVIKLVAVDSESFLILNGDIYVVKIRGQIASVEKHSIAGPGSYEGVLDALVSTSKPLFESPVDAEVPGISEANILLLNLFLDTRYYTKASGLFYNYSYFKKEYEFDTELDFFTYLDEYRAKPSNFLLDNFRLYSGALSNDGTYYFTVDSVLESEELYVQKDSLVFGPYVVDGTGRVDVPDQDAVSIVGDFYYGFAFESFGVTTAFEDVRALGASKTVYDVTFYLYNSSSFLFKVTKGEYESLHFTQDGQLADAAPPLFTGRENTRVGVSSAGRDLRLFFKNKPGELFHLMGMQVKVDLNDD